MFALAMKVNKLKLVSHSLPAEWTDRYAVCVNFTLWNQIAPFCTDSMHSPPPQCVWVSNANKIAHDINKNRHTTQLCRSLVGNRVKNDSMEMTKQTLRYRNGIQSIGAIEGSREFDGKHILLVLLVRLALVTFQYTLQLGTKAYKCAWFSTLNCRKYHEIHVE